WRTSPPYGRRMEPPWAGCSSRRTTFACHVQTWRRRTAGLSTSTWPRKAPSWRSTASLCRHPPRCSRRPTPPLAQPSCCWA
ncbi:uncharacterized protein METZ01_LOCUS429365, partial [marine metagenome]